MTVTFQFWGQLRDAAGCASLSTDCQPGPAATALRQVAVEGPVALRNLLLDTDGELRSTILISLNSAQIDPATVLDRDCELVLMSPIAGG